MSRLSKLEKHVDWRKREDCSRNTLGSAVVANYAMESSVDCTNPTGSKFGAYSLFDNNAVWK